MASVTPIVDGFVLRKGAFKYLRVWNVVHAIPQVSYILHCLNWCTRTPVISLPIPTRNDVGLSCTLTSSLLTNRRSRLGLLRASPYAKIASRLQRTVGGTGTRRAKWRSGFRVWRVFWSKDGTTRLPHLGRRDSTNSPQAITLGLHKNGTLSANNSSGIRLN
jgi:hypothetical protein